MRKLFREKDAIHIVEPAPTISPVRQTIASIPDAAVERAQIAAERKEARDILLRLEELKREIIALTETVAEGKAVRHKKGVWLSNSMFMSLLMMIIVLILFPVVLAVINHEFWHSRTLLRFIVKFATMFSAVAVFMGWLLLRERRS
jgi:hypothetical protein